MAQGRTHRRFGATVTVASAILLVQCAPPPPPPTTTTTTTSPPSVSTPPPTAAPTVHPVTAADLGASWHPGCPIAPEQLRRVDVDYLGLDGQTHQGELIVHEDLASQVITIFQSLQQLRYPIAKMRSVDHYPQADDERSMEDNNTSAFNCRPLPSGSRWSQHAYGRAIDVNPLLNPSVSGSGDLQPTNAAAYRDRGRTDPGVLHDRDPAVHAFTDRGWQWGGNWRSPRDYQHFELP